MPLPALATLVLLLQSPPPHQAPAEAGRERASHERMLRLLAERGAEAYRTDPIFGRARLEALREELTRTDDGTPLRELLQLYPALGMQELFHGDAAAAVGLLEKAHALAHSQPESERPRGMTYLTYNLAVACLRLGEEQNCIARHTAESCILPITEGGVHADPSGSRRAIPYLMEVLDVTAADTDTHLGARWLLNLAYMTIGEWPEGVPAEHRIEPATFASDAPFPRFRDVAPELGLNLDSPSGGVASEDFDGDGRLDLFVTTSDPLGQARLFLARDDGGFVERTSEAGLVGIVGGLNLTQADYDSDGDVDVLVLRGGWMLGRLGEQPKSLLENQGPEQPGRFLDVTFAAGLGEVHYPSQTGDWADHDLDGDLDLYVGNEASAQSPFRSQLFRNRGDGTFEDVAQAAGVINMRMAKGVTWGDIDGDRDPDLYVSNYLDANRLYVNRGDGTFVDQARERGVERPLDSFPTWFWDFDNDGALDLFVSTYYQTTGEARLGPVVASALGRPVRQDLNKLYRGDGRGNFREVAREQGLELFTVMMGASFGDLDNDGYPDMYLGTGYPFYDGLVPNVMYWNRGGKGFADVTTAGGFGHLQKGHGISFVDLDQDGDQDVYAQMGGAYPGDAFGDALFENPGTPNHWLKLRLVGKASNRSGVGARVRAEIVEDGRRRSVFQTVGQHGSFGNSPFELHLGLGQATRVERLEVFWPVTGETQVFTGVPGDRRVRIVEGESELALAPVKVAPFRR
ncbi:MAG TPA: CRTAC1 family protein [Planctomycetota bacterium]